MTRKRKQRQSIGKANTNYNALYQAINYQFKNVNLLRRALTRQSAIEEKAEDAAELSYQSIEFLGDRILNLVIAAAIFDAFPNFQEGMLTDILKQLISNKGIMPGIAKKLNLARYLIKGNGENIITDKMLADAMEALLGAVYLDCDNYEQVKSIISKLWQEPLMQVKFEESYKFIAHDANMSRKGLDSIVLEESKSLLKLPENLLMGQAINDGNSFFDAMAQILNITDLAKPYTEKILRLECYKYYLANKEQVDEWNKQDRSTVDYSFIQYTKSDLDKTFGQQTPLWGRPHIEGRILCRQLNIPQIQVIELISNQAESENNKCIIAYFIITNAEEKRLSSDEGFAYTGNIPTLIVEQKSLHFVPVLPKQQAVIQPTIPVTQPSSIDKKRWDLENSFENKIIAWKIEQNSLGSYVLKAPNLPMKILQARYNNFIDLQTLYSESFLPPIFIDSQKYYYENFIPLIFEEVKSILTDGLEKANVGKIKSVSLRLQEVKKPKKNHNPYIFIMAGRIPIEYSDIGKSVITLLLQGSTKEGVEHSLLAVADIKHESDHEEQTDTVFKVKFKPIHDDKNFKQYTWSAYILGSAISQQRMYLVCNKKPAVSFKDELITGELRPINSIELSNYEKHESVISHLNLSQKEAIKKFLMIKEGLQLLQGPPGTGKTTTIVTLLNALYSEGQRILVCAPSNKAVHILAERYIQRHPKEQVLFIGVENKLPPTLEEIFLHAWHYQYKKIMQLKYNLIKLFYYKDIRKTDFDEIVKDSIAIKDKTNQIFPNLDFDWHDLAVCIKKLAKLLNNSKQDKAIINNEIKTIITDIANKLGLLATKINTIGPGLEKHLLEHARIIFCTCVTAGRSIMDSIRSIDVLIVDEAGQAIEAETLIPFMLNPKKCLLVGDTKQLPPTVLSTEAVKYNFQWSMLWRLLEECKQPYSMLKEQYRMHPEIRQWPSLQFYQNELIDADTIKNRNVSILDIELFKPYMIFDIKGNEKLEQHSFYNLKEVDCVYQLVDFLVKQQKINAAKQIGVITFYKAQLEYMRKRLKHLNANVYTIDSFQGEQIELMKQEGAM